MFSARKALDRHIMSTVAMLAALGALAYAVIGDSGSSSRSTLLVIGIFLLLGVMGINAGLFALSMRRRLIRPLDALRAAMSARGAWGEPEEAFAELRGMGVEQRQTAAKLKELAIDVERERQVRLLILSKMPEAVLLIEADGRVSFRNDAAVGLLGGVPKSLDELLPFGLQRIVRDTIATGDHGEETLELGRPTKTVQVRTVPAEQQGRVLVVLTDVTQMKRVDDMRRDFAINASHELKTPVASMRALAEALVTAIGSDPAAVERFAHMLVHDAARLSRIISDLLDLSRLESQQAHHIPVSLDEVVREEVDRARQRADQAGLTVDFDCIPSRVLGSATDLSLLIRNLLDNALHYTQKGGRIGVSLEPKGDQVELTVSDTGIGITSRDLPRIFERFYRVDRARSRETGGTGLGLSIVKHVVEQHEGEVRVESELGRGSKFIVRLPQAKD